MGHRAPAALTEVCVGIGTDYCAPKLCWGERQHFSGNFWWTRGNYFLSLPPTIGSEYLAPEQYILWNDTARVAQVWRTDLQGGLMDREIYPPSAYLGVKNVTLVPFDLVTVRVK